MRRRQTALLALGAILLSACCKTPDPLPEEGWTVRVVTGAAEEGVPTLGWRASFESLSVSLEGPTEETGAVCVTSSEDWLRLTEDTLPADGIVAFSVKANGSGRRRSATLTFADAANPALRASLEVVQLSTADNDQNGDEAREVLYIGYGYDVYKALDNPMAVRARVPILDYAQLSGLNAGDIYMVVTDSHLSRLEMKYVSANSIHAYGEELTRQQTSDTENDIQGCREDCIDAADCVDQETAGNLEQQNYGHGSLEKAVAARVVDKGALMDLHRRGLIPFTEDYNDRIREIRRSSGAQRSRLIEETLVDFGTHVIIQTDLGGRIDYNFTMSKAVGFNSYEEMQQEVEYTLGRITDSERSGNRNVSSSKQAEGAITVKGGSTATRSILQGDIGSLPPSGQIPPAHLTDWLASINYSDAPERDPNLEVIHFELMPVWDLVPRDLRQSFLDATLLLIQRSDCKLPADFIGTDIYELDTNDPGLFDFSRVGDDGSLCRLLYHDGVPVLEVCNEYVPKIRTDERVTIVYPIYRQHIRLNEGLFIGDGVHQPAFVGFSGADCYVRPFEDMPPGSRIGRFFYVNGNLALKNPSTATLSGKDPRIEEDLFYFTYGAKTYKKPIVKIGSQFWTRQDLDHKMGFSPSPNSGSPTTDEYVIDGVLYTRFDYDVHRTVMEDNEWIWGKKTNDFFNDRPNMLWYLPRTRNVADLYEFLGFNPKALFPSQVSGFNACFNGYRGINDILHDNSAFPDHQDRIRYKGEINVIATRDDEGDDYSAPLLMVLDRNYNLTLREYWGDWHEDCYPVRPTRGVQFDYPDLATINKNVW